MKFLFVNTDYPGFLDRLYAGVPHGGYAQMLAARNRELFGFSDFLTEALHRLGHPSHEVHVNNVPAQDAWVREHACSPTLASERGMAVRRVLRRHLGNLVAPFSPDGATRIDPYRRRASMGVGDRLAQAALEARIKAERPDVLYNFDPMGIDGHFLKSLSHYFGVLAAQIASPIDPGADWSPYALVLTSLPNYVQRFQAAGVPSALLPLFFAPHVLDSVKATSRDLALTFVGSITRAHAARYDFLHRIATDLPLTAFGAMHDVPEDAPLARAHRGEAWGRQMYRVLARSQITLNKHIDIAEGYANNMRLYEATGMGACLVTDHGINIADLFEPGHEVLTYRTTEECIDLCRHYVARPGEAARIAQAGQRRCLSDHTVDRCAQRMVELLRRLI